jgi:hypothetical protein
MFSAALSVVAGAVPVVTIFLPLRERTGQLSQSGGAGVNNYSPILFPGIIL